MAASSFRRCKSGCRGTLYFGNYEVHPLSVMRQKIAEHMVASKHVSAHVYSVDEIDMSKVAAIRAKSKEEFEKRYETKLTFMPFFVKAAVAGLRAYPIVNASLDGTNVVCTRRSTSASPWRWTGA